MNTHDAIPTTMTVGGRTYNILDSLNDFHLPEVRQGVVYESMKIGAYLGQGHGENLLQHQQDIPAVLRGKVSFVLFAWQRLTSSATYVACIFWNIDKWVHFFFRLDAGEWTGDYRLLTVNP